MRIVNQNLETITECDLTAGRLIPATAIREDATPIDNITKFAWYDEDYEEVQMYIPNPPAEPDPESTTDDVLNALLGVTV